MHVRLLGPVDVVIDGMPRPFPGLRRKAVLAALALHSGEIVSTGRLVDVVWGETAPPTAVNALQSHISYLRGVLGSKAAIRARPPGYLLQLDSGGTDVLLAEQLWRQGTQSLDPVLGSRHLRAALALWRGPALADLAGLAWFEEQAERLGMLRLQVQRAWSEARLAAGEHVQLVPDLERMAAGHPLDEHIHAQLMVALYRCARQADALAVYHRLRRVLSEELGIDPSQALRDLETAILRQDTALDAPIPAVASSAGSGRAGSTAVPIPAQLPSAVPAFAGRDAELASLDSILATTGQAGHAAAVILAVSGTAGVGKTAFAVRWAHRVASRFPDGQLYVNLRGFDPSGSPLDPGEAVRGFLDAFGIPAERIPARLPAQAALYRSLLAGRRVLVVLDNARDAEQVRPLLPGSPACLTIVTSRSHLSGLVAAEGAHPLLLAPLTVAEARDLLVRRLGAARVASEPDAADDVIAGCARLPLALVIAAARAATHPGFPLAALAAELRGASAALKALDAGDAATDVRAVFSGSYRTLGAGAARLFRLLGLHPGPDISLTAAASLAGLPPAQAGRLLTELARAHLLTEHTPGRYASHDLLRAYAAEQAHAQEDDDARRVAIHRMLDHYLHTAETAASRLNPVRDPVASMPPQPGVTCDDVADYRQAMAWFTAERPVLLCTVAQVPAGFGTYTWQLAAALTTFLDLRGHWQDQKAVQAAGLAAARRGANQVGQAIACRGLGLAYAGLKQFGDARTHYLLALELFTELGDPTGQAQAHLNLAWLAGVQGQHDEGLHHSRQSLSHYQAAGRAAGQARALNNIGWHLAERGDFGQALGRCQQALAILRELDDRNSQAHTSDSLGYIYRRLGRHEQAIACYQEALTLFCATGDSYGEASCLSCLGDVYDDIGDGGAARRAWTRALDILDRLGHPDAGQIRAKLRPPVAIPV
jgi:DNA-binding SARP family transcriptional activator/tetratricopeptide (TPR) repeat protein